MLNRVMIIGRLGAVPELRYLQTGNAVCRLRVATDESYTDRTGNRVNRTEWHTVCVFKRQAEACERYLSTGSLVYIEGSLHTSKWQDKTGSDRYSTEINATKVIFLDQRGSTGDGGRPQNSNAQQIPESGSEASASDVPATDAAYMDEVPF